MDHPEDSANSPVDRRPTDEFDQTELAELLRRLIRDIPADQIAPLSLTIGSIFAGEIVPGEDGERPFAVLFTEQAARQFCRGIAPLWSDGAPVVIALAKDLRRRPLGFAPGPGSLRTATMDIRRTTWRAAFVVDELRRVVTIVNVDLRVRRRAL
ncbi:MAG TPA: hypothetical protein VK665_08455 [Candidatus Elarobacter sp.]|nr:hypothetical protein [Candidatus Elarobacter sp.]